MIFKAQFYNTGEPYLTVHDTEKECRREMSREHADLSEKHWDLVYHSVNGTILGGERWLWKKGSQTIMTSLIR